MSGEELLARVQQLFQELPEGMREVLLLSRVAGLSHAEIAGASGRTEGSVRNLLHRALARVAAGLEGSARNLGIDSWRRNEDWTS